VARILAAPVPKAAEPGDAAFLRGVTDERGTGVPFGILGFDIFLSRFWYFLNNLSYFIQCTTNTTFLFDLTKVRNFVAYKLTHFLGTYTKRKKWIALTQLKI
jgi:hypothetical protein